MKKIFLYLTIIAFSLTSCDDFLELYPKTQLNDGDFYQTEDDLLMGLYGTMNTMNHSVNRLYSTFIYLSDEGDSGGGPGEGGYGTDLFQYDPSNCPNWWGGEWSLGMYEGIARANLLLSKMDNATLSEEAYNRIKAELTFVRVLFYYYLFIGYEQFVIIDKVILPAEMYSVKKGTRQECYE
ncbi:MAG: RagB/SusD family nutrient uptake outer membrane protein, partial [Tannerella sp.]|nr:RagB/SusD family nutrient uptake outer membrane protein [Tannerella sp.]